MRYLYDSPTIDTQLSGSQWGGGLLSRTPDTCRPTTAPTRLVIGFSPRCLFGPPTTDQSGCSAQLCALVRHGWGAVVIWILPQNCSHSCSLHHFYLAPLPFPSSAPSIRSYYSLLITDLAIFFLCCLSNDLFSIASLWSSTPHRRAPRPASK